MSPEWKARLRLAARLGISPCEFWLLSVAEWRALTETGAAPMGRADFNELRKQFPDGKNG